MKAYDQITTVLRPTVKIYEDLCKTENADPLKIQGFEGLRRVMNCRGCFPDYVEENVSSKVVKIIQSYTGVVDKMVWRKS